MTCRHLASTCFFALLVSGICTTPLRASDVNLQLLNAAHAGDTALCSTLLAAGANPDPAPSTGALTPLMSAAAQGHPDVVRLLLEAGADPNARSSVHWNRTALMWAVDTQPTDNTATIVQMLLDGRANASLKDSQGRTAVVLAMKYAGHPHGQKAVDLLRAKLNRPDAEAK